MNELEPRLKRILDHMGPAGNRLARHFEFMKITEEELAKAGQPPGMFAVLATPESLVDVDPEIYRAHCRELLKRHATGQSFVEATQAEILCAMLAFSLRVPLNSLGWAVVDHLARQLMPQRVTWSPLGAEPYEGAITQHLQETARKLRNPKRMVSL